MSGEATPRRIVVNVDPNGYVTSCRSCQAPIRWGKTAASGAACPADAEPVVGDDGQSHYYSHFESCPKAGKHSKKGKKDTPARGFWSE